MNIDNPARILVVDDHRIVLHSIKQILQCSKDYVVIGAETDGFHAVKEAHKSKPNFVFMDFQMPVMRGDEVTAQILRFSPEIKVICFSGFGDKNTVKAMLKAGAEGFVLKDAPLEEIIHAIREVQQGRRYFSSSVSKMVEREFHQKRSPDLSFPGGELTETERRIIQFIAEGYSGKAMAQMTGLSVRTIEKHRDRIAAKLGFREVAKITKFAIRKGWSQLDECSQQLDGWSRTTGLDPMNHSLTPRANLFSP
jgi:DNA-binding NarL/FixJ family response regulator